MELTWEPIDKVISTQVRRAKIVHDGFCNMTKLEIANDTHAFRCTI